jgi:hypothetical protein
MNDNLTQPAPSPAAQPVALGYTQDQLHEYGLALVASVTQDIYADLVEAILRPLPLDHWPPLIAHSLARLLAQHPRPIELITALHHALADLAATL